MISLLEVKNLNISLKKQSELTIVEDVSFSLSRGKIVGLVGESGSGKSLTALSVMNLLDEDTFKVNGKILYDNNNLLDLKEKDICRIRTKKIAMIFQDPMTALNPIMTIKEQIEETLKLHFNDLDRDEINERIKEVLALVKIPSPDEIMNKYPFQLSGGLRQRAMIAMAICCKPEVIIADEPTTALDVTIQMEILNLLIELREKLGATVLIITHDLGVVAEICDEVMVMYLGRIVESSHIVTFFDSNMHPYSKGLLNSNTDNMKNNRFISINGNVPTIKNKPKGCKFVTRCDKAMPICSKTEPRLFEAMEGHKVRCHLYWDGVV